MAVKSEQQILNDRARAVDHRIEKLSADGHYRIHEIKTGDYYELHTQRALRALIRNLEERHDA